MAKILRGAFVEYGLSALPLFVVFQFNPEKITRSRSASFSVPSSEQDEESSSGESYRWLTMREFHKKHKDLIELQKLQEASVQEESISFDIRLDATDSISEGDFIASQFGIAPQLATLEQMILPKGESLLGGLVDKLLSDKIGFSFTGTEKPPIILFIWGRTRVMPVNITSMSIVEEEFSFDLAPTRATVSVSLEVIEGENLPYKFTQAARELMTVLNLANLPNLANTIIPK
jgi:hypothetical protein